jgi:trehalose-phosphatase
MQVSTCVKDLAAVLNKARQRQGLLLFLDYDGTLVEIAPRPELARPSPELLDSLGRLARLPKCEVVVVSGRPLKDLRALLPVPALHYLGCHGGEGLIGGKPWSPKGLLPDPEGWRKLKNGMVSCLAGLKGWWLESKPLGFALHYREAEPAEEPLIIRETRPWLDRIGKAGHWQILKGKKVIEILPQGVTKGAAIQEILGFSGFCELFPVYIGDDVTDESAFQILKNKGLTIKVGLGVATAASYSLSQPTAVIQLLTKLAEPEEAKK